MPAMQDQVIMVVEALAQLLQLQEHPLIMLVEVVGAVAVKVLMEQAVLVVVAMVEIILHTLELKQLELLIQVVVVVAEILVHKLMAL
jgi:hypothetical protein